MHPNLKYALTTGEPISSQDQSIIDASPELAELQADVCRLDAETRSLRTTTIPQDTRARLLEAVTQSPPKTRLAFAQYVVAVAAVLLLAIPLVWTLRGAARPPSAAFLGDRMLVIEHFENIRSNMTLISRQFHARRRVYVELLAVQTVGDVDPTLRALFEVTPEGYVGLDPGGKPISGPSGPTWRSPGRSFDRDAIVLSLLGAPQNVDEVVGSNVLYEGQSVPCITKGDKRVLFIYGSDPGVPKRVVVQQSAPFSSSSSHTDVQIVPTWTAMSEFSYSFVPYDDSLFDPSRLPKDPALYEGARSITLRDVPAQKEQSIQQKVAQPQP